jgi:hypothetical protein
MDDSTIVVYHGCDFHRVSRIVVSCGRDCPPALLASVVMTPQPLDETLWFVYTSPQSIADQLLPALHGVDQLSLEFGSSRSELCLLLAFGLPAPSVSVPVLMTRCSTVLVTSHSGACSALV